jgi:hypothetical protein
MRRQSSQPSRWEEMVVMIWGRGREPAGHPHKAIGKGAGASSSEHADGNHRWGRSQGLDPHGDNHGAGKHKWPGSVGARLRVELDTVMENRVHDMIKGHKCALEKMADV